MHISITCDRDEETDRLLPYVARTDFRDIEARDISPALAIAGVRQICLACLAHFVTPPSLIRFTVTRAPVP